MDPVYQFGPIRVYLRSPDTAHDHHWETGMKSGKTIGSADEWDWWRANWNRDDVGRCRPKPRGEHLGQIHRLDHLCLKVSIIFSGNTLISLRKLAQQ